MDRLYTQAGYSIRNGVLKLRFTTDKYRERVLLHNGHVDVHLFELPEQMSKISAAIWLANKRNIPRPVKELAKAMLSEPVKQRLAA